MNSLFSNAIRVPGSAFSAAPNVRFGATSAVSVVDQSVQDAIVNAIAERKVFSADKVNAAVKEFFNLGFDATYGAFFSTEAMAEHVYGFLCAEGEVAGGNAFSHSTVRDNFAFFFCEDAHQCQIETMKKVEQFIVDRAALAPTHGISVRSYHGAGKVLFAVQLDKFINPTPADAIKAHGSPSIEIVATETFLKRRSDDAKERYQALLNVIHESFHENYQIHETPSGEIALSIGFRADRPAYFGTLASLLSEIPGLKINKKFMESFSNGVQTYTFYVTGATKEAIECKANLINQLPNRPGNAISQLLAEKVLTAEETVFSNCIIIFSFYFSPPTESEDYARLQAMVEHEPVGLNRLKSLRASLSQEIMSEHHLGDVIASNPQLVKEIYFDFKNGSTEESRKVISDKVNVLYEKDVHTRNIFQAFLAFNGAVVKHNFYKMDKAAMAFRLDPKTFMGKLDFPRMPHGIFMFVGPQWRGFHVRFTDIARGGVRMIISDPKAYASNKQSLFQENYNLAHTQLLKNKDIPEGGSKGTILVSTRTLHRLDENDKMRMFRQYVDALLDVTIPKQAGVIDNLKQEEIIFLGPDENTAGHYPAVAALHSKGRGYSAWKSFTTGKDPSLGGIPHDTYGMTTNSVRACVEGIYEKLGLDQTTLTKFQTGGPDGDLGSNEILCGKEKYTAIVDGAGVLYDPNGLNREELLRLAKERKMVDHFDTKKLSPQGFYIAADKNRDLAGEAVVLPDGTKVTKSVEFRNNFHLSNYINTDVFVPCGGRPRSIVLSNVHKLLRNHPTATGEMMLRGLVDAKPSDLKYKIIVEGANLFISHDARLALEKCGVVLIKDATANKGGVTSSSLEVFTGLALNDEEHKRLMCGKADGTELPAFYKQLVTEISAIIHNNAKREFELIWRIAQEHPEIPKAIITDRLSRKIVEIRGFIYESSMFEDKKFVRYVLDCYAPKTLKDAVSVDEMMKRVPENYQRAICSIWLASNYVYTKGIDSNEFDFYEFMRSHRANA